MRNRQKGWHYRWNPFRNRWEVWQHWHLRWQKSAINATGVGREWDMSSHWLPMTEHSFVSTWAEPVST